MRKIFFMITFIVASMQLAAQTFDDLPTPGGEEKVIDNTPDSIAKALMNRPAPGSTRQGTNPVLFLIGNSTMRNGTMGNGNNGQWGWGYFASDFFDGRKISVENQALGGMSTRNFYTDLWPAVRQALKWLNDAAKNDYADAQFNLAQLYLNPHHPASREHDVGSRAIALLRRAAAQGHTAANAKLEELGCTTLQSQEKVR